MEVNMLNYIYDALHSFRHIFSKHSTWLVFCMIVLGFCCADQIIGVSSFCRFWGLGVSGYNTFLAFFRSSAWALDPLIYQWTVFVLSQNVLINVQGRAILLGDHTYVPKDGRRMPGVVTLHQDSETQSKPSYFRGHCWGAIGVLIGTLAAPFSLPLALKIHQGLIHIGQEKEEKENKETLGTRIVQMALDIAIRHDMLCILVLDAFFPSGAVFKLASSIWSVKFKQPLLTLIIKAKKNYVAYFEAEKPEEKKVGRPPQYGEKVTLMEIFDHRHLFSRVTCKVYGKVEEVCIMALNLKWKPAACIIRFVFAITSHGPIILMCSDLNQNPILALQLYCGRTRIEIMFDMLKHLISAFRYRFWSKRMPLHSRKPKKNRKLKKPSSQDIPTVQLCWDACERFVMLGAIALGLLAIIAVKYSNSVWSQFNAFLRTRSRELPSERTVKHVISRLVLGNFFSLAPGAIMQEIRERYFGEKFPSQDISLPQKLDDRIASG